MDENIKLSGFYDYINSLNYALREEADDLNLDSNK